MGGVVARSRLLTGLAAGAAISLGALLISGCGGTPRPAAGSSLPSVPPTTAITTRAPLPAGKNPSLVSRMVCASEAEGEINYALGVKPIAPLRRTWVNHLYSCRYQYAHGAMVLAVKEESSYPETIAYFDGLGRRLGDVGQLNGLGQGAFQTRNGSVVVRKDYKILLVDVSGLPHVFGDPPTSAGDVAITVADVVLACWAGD
jgi:hypothetical protein